MRECSIFCDESGDFGKFDPRSPYYIATFVLHDQVNSITDLLEKLDASLASFRMRGETVHAGPLIRREDEYLNLDINTRRQLFHRLFTFARASKTAYHPFVVDKRHLTDEKSLSDSIAKQVRTFLLNNLAFFQEYDRIVLYYDFGQAELTKILVNAFGDILNHVTIRKMRPENYRVFQAADLLCTLELLALKAENKALSRSELSFFHSERALMRTYIKPIRQKRC